MPLFFALVITSVFLEYRPDFPKDHPWNMIHASPGKKLTHDILLELLHDCHWNKAEAGRRLGLSRTAIWKYMKKWNIPLKQPA
jgi:transcriptional regulator of acetoin/glycerol metabolism